MRTISRRQFLHGASSAATLSVMSTRTVASVAIGSGTLTTVSDGNLVLPIDFAIGSAPKAEASKILAKYGYSESNVHPNCNVSVFRDGTNTVLFDVGSGPDFMPSAGALLENLALIDLAPAGALLENLALIDLAPEDVTHVLITHAHPDHIWGLLDDFGDPVFANAAHMIGRREWDYWWDPETVNLIGEQRAVFAVGARRRFKAMEDVFEQFDDGEEVVRGVQAIATYGHTPGHMSFEVRSGNQASLIIGDAIANHHLAFERPEWPSGSDQDPDLGTLTRKALFDRIVAENLPVVGFHFPGSGYGTVEKSADGYRFLEGDL